MLGQGPHTILAQTLLRIAGLLFCLMVAAAVWWAGALAKRLFPKRWRSARTDAEQHVAWYAAENIPKLYLLVALAWGLILVFVTPPLQTFDELAHYYRSWSVAEGQIAVPSSGRSCCLRAPMR